MPKPTTDEERETPESRMERTRKAYREAMHVASEAAADLERARENVIVCRLDYRTAQDEADSERYDR